MVGIPRWLPQQVETGPYGRMKITNSQKKRNVIEPKQSESLLVDLVQHYNFLPRSNIQDGRHHRANLIQDRMG